MTDLKTASYPETYLKTLFGFWVYLMTDCILFATLFATYAVLHNNIFGGPSSHELFDLPHALQETLVLLTSSFASGLATLAAFKGNKAKVALWYAVAFILGIVFLTLELQEFASFVRDGNSWQKSAFLSSFFTLVGTHGLHVSLGLLWMIVLIPKVLISGLTPQNMRRLSILGLFWHFLDVIWIFIFTFVYLMGKIG